MDQPPPQDKSTHDDLRTALFVAQYESVRQVVLHARQIQHSIVSWSTAALGVLLASGAVLAGGGTAKVLEGSSGLAFILLFGLAIPALTASSFISWIAEVARMRRAAWFLRDLEYTLFKSNPASQMPVPLPIYDTVVARGPDGTGSSVTKVGRKAITYLYAGLYFFATTIGVWTLWEYESQVANWGYVEGVGTFLASAGAAWFAWSVRQGYATAAPYGTKSPRLFTQDVLVSLFSDES